MRSLWMGVVPGPEITRVLVQDGPRQTLLKARLPRIPAHPRALPALGEAVALWCGYPVHAAIAVGDLQTSSDRRPWLDTIDLGTRTPLCEIQIVHHAHAPQRRDEIEGLGDFRDVRQLLLFEVAQ